MVLLTKSGSDNKLIIGIRTELTSNSYNIRKVSTLPGLYIVYQAHHIPQ